MKKQGIYAFGVISTPESQLKTNNILLISFKDLTLIGKMVLIDDFQKKIKEALRNPYEMEEVLKEHQSIQNKLMKKTTLVPFQFGTILKNKKGAKEILKTSSVKFKRLLSRLENKEEWGLRLFADMGRFKTLIKSKVETTKKGKESGTAYLLAKKQEEKAEKAVSEKLSFYSQEVFSLLEKKATEAQVTESSQRFSEQGEILASTFAFLVNKNKTKEFKEKFAALENKFQSQGLRLRLSGPWPAYNFL